MITFLHRIRVIFDQKYDNYKAISSYERLKNFYVQYGPWFHNQINRMRNDSESDANKDLILARMSFKFCNVL